MDNDSKPIDYKAEADKATAGDGAPATKAVADFLKVLESMPEPKLFGILAFVGFIVIGWASRGTLSWQMLKMYFASLVGFWIYMLLLSMITILIAAVRAKKMFVVNNIILIATVFATGFLLALYLPTILSFVSTIFQTRGATGIISPN